MKGERVFTYCARFVESKKAKKVGLPITRVSQIVKRLQTVKKLEKREKCKTAFIPLLFLYFVLRKKSVKRTLQ